MIGSYGFIERVDKDGEKYLRVHTLDSRDERVFTDYYEPDWLTKLESERDTLKEKLDRIKEFVENYYDGTHNPFSVKTELKEILGNNELKDFKIPKKTIPESQLFDRKELES